MSTNFYEKVYLSQAGSGLDVYSDLAFVRNQKGNGFFGRFYKQALMPFMKRMLPVVKDKALKATTEIIGEIKKHRGKRKRKLIHKKKSHKKKRKVEAKLF